MELKYTICTVLLAVILGCKGPAKEVPTIEISSAEQRAPAPSASRYIDLDGNMVELTDYKGKKILLNYWATWCRPCLEEMPALMRTQELLENENYVFLLASDQPLATIKAFTERKEYDFKYLKYKGSLTEEGVNALPTTFIYNEEGEQVDKIIGATEWDAPEMIKKLNEIH